MANHSHYIAVTYRGTRSVADIRRRPKRRNQPAQTASSLQLHSFITLPGRGFAMRVKSNKALRKSARLARRPSASSAIEFPEVLPFWRRPVPRMGATTVAAAVASILYGAGGTAHAQEAAPAATTTATAPESLQEVVVTASATGVKKLDASYSIVSVNQDIIKQTNPKSTADLLKVSPGIWPESSGGQTGANIEVAGFPSGGDAPFF